MNEPTERKRRHFSDDQKATVVRRHLGDKVPVSDLADEYQMQPSLIYLWVKQVLDQAERAFRQPDGQHARAARGPGRWLTRVRHLRSMGRTAERR